MKVDLPSFTPLDILLNRYFYISTDQYNLIAVEGQLFDHGRIGEVIEGIFSLELPAVTRREVENYFERVDRWMEFRTGKSISDPTMKLTSKMAADIFVEAVIDLQPQQRNIIQIQNSWEVLYWKAQDLKKKKKEADEICLKKVRQKMSWGLVILACNIGFIWSGTYIFYSWDIIEPIAYFVSSLGAIILASQYFKLGRPYSNYAYQQYLMKKIEPGVYKQTGFSLQEL